MFPPSDVSRSLQSEPPPPYNEVYCDQETLPPEYTDIAESTTSTTTDLSYSDGVAIDIL